MLVETKVKRDARDTRDIDGKIVMTNSSHKIHPTLSKTPQNTDKFSNPHTTEKVPLGLTGIGAVEKKRGHTIASGAGWNCACGTREAAVRKYSQRSGGGG